MNFLESIKYYFQKKQINLIIQDSQHPNFFKTEKGFLFENNIYFKGENIGKEKSFNTIFIFFNKYYCLKKSGKKYGSYDFNLNHDFKKIDLKSVIMTAISSLDNNYKNVFIDLEMLKIWGLILPVALFITFISLLILASNFISMLNLSYVQNFIDEIIFNMSGKI